MKVVAKTLIQFVVNATTNTLFANTINLFYLKIFTALHYYKTKCLAYTMHRPFRVNQEPVVATLIQNIIKFSSKLSIIFLAYSRAKNLIQKINFSLVHLLFCNPLHYFELYFLVHNSVVVMPYSAGVKKEKNLFNVQFHILRYFKERPKTFRISRNFLVCLNTVKLKIGSEYLHSGVFKRRSTQHAWDGEAPEVIVTDLVEIHNL